MFHAADVVTFSPDGQGIANAFSTSKCLHLSGEYTNSVCADHCHYSFLFTVTGKLVPKRLGLSRQYVGGLHWC